MIKNFNINQRRKIYTILDDAYKKTVDDFHKIAKVAQVAAAE